LDWSDKKETDEIDTFCVELRNEHTRKQFHPGVVKFLELYVRLPEQIWPV